MVTLFPVALSHCTVGRGGTCTDTETLQPVPCPLDLNFTEFPTGGPGTRNPALNSKILNIAVRWKRKCSKMVL